jgi:hypothetical protein
MCTNYCIQKHSLIIFYQQLFFLHSVELLSYFVRYITSLTSFTVLGMSGKAAATRLGA